MLLHYLRKNTKTEYLLLSIITILFSSLSSAQEYPERDAQEIARSFFYGETTKAGQQETISTIYYSEQDVENPVSVFQKEEGGYLLITKTESEYIITGYSPSGILTPGDMPGGLTDIIKTYESSENITKTKLTSLTKASIIVEPLLDREGVSLNQYWHTEVGDCPTGCTATAMAQIMSYYKYPDSGTGNPCYNHPEYGTLCADIENTVYDWNNMTDADYELLSYHMAVAMKMDFCGHEEGSIPLSPDYLEVLENYYSYHVRTGTTDLYYLLYELDNERPVYVALPGDPGHAVVVDGYDSDGYCHVNFGWNGRYNGYFLLNTGNTLSTGSHEFGTNISGAAYISKKVLPAHPDDSLALLALHNGFNGTTGWNLSEPVMKWDGVLLMNGRVTELNLGQLTGTISSDIGTLSMLRRLSLKGNFQGQLPSSVSSLTSLTELTIFSDNTSQKISLPSEIGNLVNLESINMMNSVEGEIPASIGNLSNLEFLNLNSGNMTGIIPPEIGNLSKLHYLNVSNNNLTGNIPTEIQGLVSANTIDLSSNDLTGSIPDGIGNLTQLSYLYLQDNQLSGVVPGSIGNCSGIVSMNLSDNMLSGILPEGLGNMNGMEDLYLGYNNFTSVPVSIGRLSKLKYLNLEYNDLVSLPDSIINIEVLRI
ncbi:MAG TPA: C10 family peptidase, partial [Bacteroidales bacterium]|nr:C10 family peptidase [Bacteroidales bacterium]